jgi:2-dehydro-3-deoxy-L-rhamnonate dehydrogenase (NAD+)
MNKIDLTNRGAIITGGAQGIGFAIAERLRAAGICVAMGFERTNACNRCWPVGRSGARLPWRRVLDVNLNGIFHWCRAVVPAMLKRGYRRIVNIASIAGKEGIPDASAYSASKAGVIALTKSLGKELAEYNISVNCITPEAARTRLFEQMTQEHIEHAFEDSTRPLCSRGRNSSMVAWLVSEENSYTTGATFDLSGGCATY